MVVFDAGSQFLEDAKSEDQFSTTVLLLPKLLIAKS